MMSATSLRSRRLPAVVLKDAPSRYSRSRSLVGRGVEPDVEDEGREVGPAKLVGCHGAGVEVDVPAVPGDDAGRELVAALHRLRRTG